MEEHADAMKLENLVYEDKVKREFAVEAQEKHKSVYILRTRCE